MVLKGCKVSVLCLPIPEFSPKTRPILRPSTSKVCKGRLLKGLCCFLDENKMTVNLLKEALQAGQR